MKCQEAIPLIDLLLDDELSAQIAAVVMDHIKACPSCQEIWDSRTLLRDRFLTLSKSVKVPDQALTRLDAQINKQGRVIAFGKRLPAMYAAAVLLAGLAFFLFNNMATHRMGAPITASEIVDSYQDYSSPATKEASVADIKNLSRQVGFPVAIMNLPNWQLTSRQIVKLPGHSGCMVRLVYTSETGGKQQQLAVYEACQGQIKASGLKEHKMDGRVVCCGKVKDRSVVYFPKDGRDHLLVSSIPEHDLMALALRT